MRVLVVEDEIYLAEAIRDGLRLSAIAADLAFDGDQALAALGVNEYEVNTGPGGTAAVRTGTMGPAGTQDVRWTQTVGRAAGRRTDELSMARCLSV